MSSSPTAGIGGEAARSEPQQGGPERLRAFLHDACAEVRRCGWCGGRRDLPLLVSQRWGPDCILQMHARCWFRHRRAERVPKGHHSGSAVVEMILAALLTARPPPLLLTMLVPGDPPPISIDPFRASREAGLPWWLPQNLQDGLPDDWPALKEQRASRAASFPRWLSQTEQDGLPDDRPAVMEVSQSKARAVGRPLSMLRRAIFSTSEDGIFRTRLETQPNDQDNPGSAASDASSGAR